MMMKANPIQNNHFLQKIKSVSEIENKSRNMLMDKVYLYINYLISMKISIVSNKEILAFNKSLHSF